MTELESFDAVFPELVSVLCDSALKDRELAPAAEWFQEVIGTCGELLRNISGFSNELEKMTIFSNH